MSEIKNTKSSFETLFLRSEIADVVGALAERISFDYENRPYTLIAILNGSFIFVTDLLKTNLIKCEIEFIKVSSYKNETSPQKQIRSTAIFTNLKDKNVLLVDDIVDTGNTMKIMKDLLYKHHEVADIKTCSLLYKPTKGAERPDYVGFSIKDCFVFGYGLDLFGKHRHFSNIYTYTGLRE